MQSSSATHYEFFTNLLQWSDQAQFAAATSSPQNLIGFKHLNDKGLFLAYASCPRLGHGPKRNVDTVSVNRAVGQLGVGEGPACLGAGRGDAPAPAGPRGPSALGTRLRLAGWGCLRQVSAHVTRHRSSQRRPFPNARCPCGGAAEGQERVPRSASESETRPALGRRLSQGRPRVWGEGVARPRPRHGWCCF